MLLAELVATSTAVAAARGRKDKAARLADLLRRLGPDEIVPAVSWLCGALPQGKIGVGWALVRGLAEDGAAAEGTLTVGEVDQIFSLIGKIGGPGSGEERKKRLAALWARATREERELLARVLIGEVRQGSLDGVMAEAVALATGLSADAVRRAQMLAGDLATVAAAALAEGAAGLARFSLELFRAVEPMLASPCEDVAEALADLGEAAFEWKLDGARVQVHRDGDRVKVFTRGLADVTAQVPEVVAAALALPAERILLDGEAIALRPDGRPYPFQETMSRFTRRSGGTLALSPFFFDVLLLGDEPLLDRPARERLAALDRLVPETQRPPRIVTSDVAVAEDFLADALARGHEGAMAKGLDAAYQVGARGQAWRKLKRAKVLDLVVLAVEQGSGRRSAWLSNLHLGAYDPDTGGFVMLGKTFKGMTDEMLAWQTEKLGALATAREGPVVHVRPELVVEIAFDGVQQSPHYPGGMALRFARVKRYREDKRADQADTIATVRKIFAADRGEG